ncbi:DUF805 domain-containing protein [Sinomonas atrocyanea]
MTIQQPPYTAGGAVPPLELPYYGAPPVEAVKRVFQKYAVFSGRASRSEYWWWALASAIASGILNAISPTVVNGQSTGASPLGGLWFFATVVPGLAVAARRLHDANLSAWLLLLVLVPVLGWIALIVMLVQRENPLGQRFDRYPGSGYLRRRADAQQPPYGFQQPPQGPGEQPPQYPYGVQQPPPYRAEQPPQYPYGVQQPPPQQPPQQPPNPPAPGSGPEAGPGPGSRPA